MNFKKYLYAFAAVLMTVIAPSCVKDGFGEPMISTDNSTYEIPLEGGEVKVMLTSTRSWTARVFPATSLDDIEGIVVEPASGEASSEPIEVTIKATANASYPRAALISFETSVVSAAVTVNQDGPVARPAAELTVAEFLNKEVDASIYYKLTGTIKNLKNTEYGNFDLVDETGSVYVYGLTTEKTGSNDKSFSKLGLKEGDVLTLEGTRAAYNGVAQVGGPAYYISHEAGDAPAAPGPKSMTIADAVAQTDSVLVSGTVMALCAKGFILQDESGVAFIYDTNYSQTYSVGDQVKVGGKPGAYNYANQITPNAKYYEKTGSIEVTYPDPVVLNAAKVAEMKDGAGADKNVGMYDPFYVTVEGIVRASGNYFNLDIDGVDASASQGSFYQLTDAQKEELTALKDKSVVLTGYFQSISQSGGVPKFFNVIYLTITEKASAGGEEPEPETPSISFTETASVAADATTYSLEVTANVAWTATPSEGVTLEPSAGEGNATVVLTFAANETLEAVTRTVTFTAGELTKTFTLTQEAAETPAEPEFEAGQYWIVAGDNAAMPKSGNYGYLSFEPVWKSSSSLASVQTNAFTFEAVAGGFNIKDSNGKYLYAAIKEGTTYHTSFQLGTSPTDAAVWTVEKNDDGTYTIKNTTSNSWIQCSKQYNSFGHYPTAQSNALMPTLVKVENAVPAVTLASSLTFEAEGGSQTITLPEGVTINPSSNNAVFTATASANVVTVSAAATTEAQSGVLTLVLNYNGFSITKTVNLTQKAAPVAGETVVLHETFDKCQHGTSFVNNAANNSDTSIKTDVSGWTFVKGYEAYKSAKFGGSSAAGSATTPKLGVSGDMTVTFVATPWAKDETTLKLSVLGGGNLNVSTVTMETSFSEHTVTITGATAETQLKFESNTTKKCRFFLDDVKIVKK